MTDKYYFIIREKTSPMKIHEIQKTTTEKIRTIKDIEIQPPLSIFVPPDIEDSHKTIKVPEQLEFILEHINEINKITTAVMKRTSYKRYGFYIGCTKEFW